MPMWNILVPADKPKHFPGKKRWFSIKHHRLWDKKVAAISGGLTIFQPAKGTWISREGEKFEEKVIPVWVSCSREQIEKIMDMTARHYGQLAVLAYQVSDTVLLKYYPSSPKEK